jgi:CDGSH iron-sulfur domain-containing protein 3
MQTPSCAQTAPIEVNLEPGRTYWWCACGLSKTQPFCDGSHKRTSFSPLEYRATEAGIRQFCGCKRTANPPFCDAKHACRGAPSTSLCRR